MSPALGVRQARIGPQPPERPKRVRGTADEDAEDDAYDERVLDRHGCTAFRTAAQPRPRGSLPRALWAADLRSP